MSQGSRERPAASSCRSTVAPPPSWYSTGMPASRRRSCSRADAPEAANEIALGPDTLAALHKHVGDDVSVVGPDGTALDLRVVGQIVPPAAVDSLESFGNGAVIPIATAEQATGGGPPPTPDAFLVTFRPGVDRTAALARLDQLFPRTVLVAPSSVDVDTLRHVDWLPVVLAGLVGLVTAGTLVHVVVSNARRRRRELGVLRALGFTGSQVVASVTCMATVLVLGMLLIGLPAGHRRGPRRVDGHRRRPRDGGAAGCSRAVVAAAGAGRPRRWGRRLGVAGVAHHPPAAGACHQSGVSAAAR